MIATTSSSNLIHSQQCPIEVMRKKSKYDFLLTPSSICVSQQQIWFLISFICPSFTSKQVPLISANSLLFFSVSLCLCKPSPQQSYLTSVCGLTPMYAISVETIRPVSSSLKLEWCERMILLCCSLTMGSFTIPHLIALVDTGVLQCRMSATRLLADSWFLTSSLSSYFLISGGTQSQCTCLKTISWSFYVILPFSVGWQTTFMQSNVCYSDTRRSPPSLRL